MWILGQYLSQLGLSTELSSSIFTMIASDRWHTTPNEKYYRLVKVLDLVLYTKLPSDYNNARLRASHQKHPQGYYRI